MLFVDEFCGILVYIKFGADVTSQYVGICSYARKNADGLCYNFWSPPFAIWLAISIKNILCFFYFDTDYCIVAWDICSDIFCGGIYAYHRDNFL